MTSGKVSPIRPDDDLMPWEEPPAEAVEPPPAAPPPEPAAEPEPATKRKRRAAVADDGPPPEPPADHDQPPFPFTLLGHDHGTYYYMGHGTDQLTFLKASQHTPANLLVLAPLSFWARRWEANKRGFDVDQAASDLITLQHSIGVYSPDRIRGRGAWWDNERQRAVVHLGDRLLIDGEPAGLHDHGTKYIYESAAALPISTALRNAEAVKLIDLCSKISWENPVAARLLAGWIVNAQICGALRWKPNLQLLGPHEAGKSTVIDKIVWPSLGANVLYALGGTSEASLRALLKADAIPIIIDDMDSSTARTRENNQAIYNLMRIFSGEGGGSVHKASQSGGAPISYKAHACYIYSGTTLEADKSQDISRIAILKLVPRKFERGQYTNLLAEIEATLTPEFSSGLFARCIKLIPVIRKNAEVFAQSIASQTGSRRSGDVYGHLFAGAYSLHSQNLIMPREADDYVGTRDEVMALIREEKQVIAENNDGEKCLAHLLEQVVTDTDSDTGRTGRWSIYELIQETQLPAGGSYAHHLLRRNGIVVKGIGADAAFFIANDHSQLRHLYDRSQWPTGWGSVLKTIQSATATGNVRFGSRTTRATRIPLTHISANKNPAEAG